MDFIWAYFIKSSKKYVLSGRPRASGIFEWNRMMATHIQGPTAYTPCTPAQPHMHASNSGTDVERNVYTDSAIRAVQQFIHGQATAEVASKNKLIFFLTLFASRNWFVCTKNELKKYCSFYTQKCIRLIRNKTKWEQAQFRELFNKAAAARVSIRVRRSFVPKKSVRSVNVRPTSFYSHIRIVFKRH